MDETENLRKELLIYELIDKRYQQELGRIDSLDQKTSNFILFSGIISAFVTFLANSENKLLFVIPFIILAISIVFGSFSCMTQTYVGVPNTTEIIQRYTKKEESYSSLMQDLSVELSNAIEKNNKIIKKKVKNAKICQIFFILGVLAILILLGYTVIH